MQFQTVSADFPTDYSTLFVSGNVVVNLIHHSKVDYKSPLSDEIKKQIYYSLEGGVLKIQSHCKNDGQWKKLRTNKSSRVEINVPYNYLTVLNLSDEASVNIQWFDGLGLEATLKGHSVLQVHLRTEALWLKCTGSSIATVLGNAGVVNLQTQQEAKIDISYLSVKNEITKIAHMGANTIISKELLMNCDMIEPALIKYRIADLEWKLLKSAADIDLQNQLRLEI